MYFVKVYRGMSRIYIVVYLVMNGFSLNNYFSLKCLLKIKINSHFLFTSAFIMKVPLGILAIKLASHDCGIQIRRYWQRIAEFLLHTMGMSNDVSATCRCSVDETSVHMGNFELDVARIYFLSIWHIQRF